MKTAKLIFMGLAATVVAASCSKENVSKPSAETKMITVSFVANASDYTKATVDGKKMSWSPGDVIGVAAAESGTDIYPFTTKDGGSSAVFTGQLPDGFKAGKAIYPFIEGVTLNSTNDNFQVMETPSRNQTAVLNNIPYGQNNMWARFTDITAEEITFHHACAFVKVSVKGSDVAAIKLTTNSDDTKDEKLKGALTLPEGKKANVSTKDGVSSSSSGVKDATLRSADGGALVPGTYYITILATAKGSKNYVRILTDLTLTYIKTDGSMYSRTTNKEITIVPGAVYTLPGTEEDCIKVPAPKEIANADDLQAFIAGVKAEEYQDTDVVKLTGDIDLKGVTLGALASYSGIFDGNGKSFKNWECNAPLFGDLSGTVKNLTIGASCTVNLHDIVATFISNNNTGTIENCTNNAEMKVSTKCENTAAIRVAPFAAINKGTIKGCVNNGAVAFFAETDDEQATYVGGMAGSTSGGKFESCKNNAPLSCTVSNATKATQKRVGGITAICNKGAESVINDCVNTQKGTITILDNSETQKITTVNGGGIVGEIEAAAVSEMKNCKSFGDLYTNIDNDSARLGGLIAFVGKYESADKTLCEGCVVNCGISAVNAGGEDPENPLASGGVVAGRFSGQSTSQKVLSLGSVENPIKVAGSVTKIKVDGTVEKTVNLDDSHLIICVGKKSGSNLNTSSPNNYQFFNVKFEAVTKE